MKAKDQHDRSEWHRVGRLSGLPLYRNRRTGEYAIEADYEWLRALSPQEEELLREQLQQGEEQGHHDH